MQVLKSLTIIEDGTHRLRWIQVERTGVVRVFDGDREFRFRADVRGALTTWQLLSRIAPGIVAAELRAVAIETLADRCRTGWRPAVDEIDPLVPQNLLRRSRFAVDPLRYADDPDLVQHSPATILSGRDKFGRLIVTGEILWIDDRREFAVCADGIWWTPGPEVDERRGGDQFNED